MTMGRKLCVAVVDDDPAVLDGVGRLLRLHGFDTRGYSSAPSLLADLEELCPDCIIADLSMPELTGLELQRELTKFNRDYPLVFITGRGDIRSSVQAMRGGAVDFLPKPFEQDELLDAVRRALERSRVSRELDRTVGSFRERLSSLTQREREVFDHVVEGRLNKQIAAELGITEKTVKVHRARVMRKMAVRSVAQLARIAERIGAQTSC